MGVVGAGIVAPAAPTVTVLVVAMVVVVEVGVGVGVGVAALLVALLLSLRINSFSSYFTSPDNQSRTPMPFSLAMYACTLSRLRSSKSMPCTAAVNELDLHMSVNLARASKESKQKMGQWVLWAPGSLVLLALGTVDGDKYNTYER